MKLRVTLRRPDGSAEDIALTAEPGVRVGELADAIVAADPAATYPAATFAPGTVTLEASSPTSGLPAEMLDPEDTLADLALASGAEVGVVALRETPRPDVAYIEVLSGRAAGRRYTVPRGSTVIGRGSDAGIAIDDPMISQRHARLHVGRDRIELIDLNSANGIIVQGVPVGRLELQRGQDALLGSTVIRAGYLPSSDQQVSPVTEVRLTRSPSVEPRYLGRELDGAEPPVPPEPQPFPWLAAVVPAIAGGAMFAVTQSPLTLIFVAISPIMMFGTWITARSTQSRRRKLDDARFVSQIERLSARLAKERVAEAETRAREAVPLHEIYQAVEDRSPLVWTRRPEHWSFLQLRLGVGDVPTRNSVKDPGNTDRAVAERTAELESLVDSYRIVPRTPVVEQLGDAGAIGIAGDPGSVAAYVRALTAQLAGLHAPADLVIGGLFGPAWTAQFSDAKWLPHAMNSEGVFGGVPFADTASAAAGLLSQLEETIAMRAPRASDGLVQLGAIGDKRAAMSTGGTVGADGGAYAGSTDPLPAIVVLISDDAPVDRARLIQVLEKAAGRGVYPIWMSAETATLPAACRTFVEIEASGTARVGFVRWGRTLDPVEVEGLTHEQFARFTRILASYVDAGVIPADTSDVPRSVPMLQLIGKEMATSAGAVVDRWEQNGSIAGGAAPKPAAPKLRAIVGQSAAGAMHLDLRAQGPHALVGGTTGSGKSEFLQAWVLGMAAEYSPQRVTFLFVDYKGGAAFAECTALPHCVGLVTDLSPHLVRRALVSLRAELHHRETLFTRKKAKDIIELEKRGDPDTPPALVIVIDEFAALVNEVPDFVDGVVDVAQRGRSLGIHLIMATQRPAGVIKDSLRANTNMRVALRMADEIDSDDVIGTKDAAAFDPSIPGRGAAKTGPGRLSVFQSAYTGGWSFIEEDAPDVALESFAFGPPRAWEAPKPDAPAERDLGPTDQQRLVATMIEAAESATIVPPRRPWLDELAPVYDLTLLRQRTDERLLLGVQDVPQRQSQETAYFEPDTEGHLAIFGTGGAGKSTALRTLAIAAGITPRGGPVEVYALDFGSGGLRMLESMPHVGAVIPADAGERVTRLFRMLKAELDRRGEAYAAVNAGTISQYRSLAGAADEARILLLIDGFPSFRSEYEAVTGRAESYAVLQQILTDGRSVGIHVALTADRGQAVPTALQSTIQKRVVLRLSDSDAYAMVGAPRDVLSAESVPGRAIVDGRESQIAVIAGTTDPRAQAQAIAEFAAAMRRQGRADAAPIEALPEVYTAAERLPASVSGRPVLGLSGDTLAAIGFEPTGLFVVAGAPQSGRTTALLGIADSLVRANPAARRYFIGNARSPLHTAVPWTGTATDGGSATRLIDEILQDERGMDGVSVFLEGATDFASSTAEFSLADFAKRAKRGDGLLVAEGETSDWTTGFGLLGDIKSARRGIVLQPDTHDGEVVLKTPFPRLLKREFPPGRAVYAAGGKTTRVQLPMRDE